MLCWSSLYSSSVTFFSHFVEPFSHKEGIAMKRLLWVCLLVLGLIFSWTLVYAGDSNVIPSKKNNYAPVAKTGQTTSYRTHDDGDLRKGVAWPTPRFTDKNDGTVTDNLTNLIWLKNANCAGAKVNWNTAIDYCAALYDGCTSCLGTEGDCSLSDGSSAGDWRLPNRNELLSLVDIAYFNPALSNAAGTGRWSEGDPFTGIQSGGNYWSSSTLASRTNHAWFLASVGTMKRQDKSIEFHVWCVRGGN